MIECSAKCSCCLVGYAGLPVEVHCKCQTQSSSLHDTSEVGKKLKVGDFIYDEIKKILSTVQFRWDHLIYFDTSGNLFSIKKKWLCTSFCFLKQAIRRSGSKR